MRRSAHEPQGSSLGIAHIDGKGHLVIPPEALHRTGWSEGQRLDLSVDATGRVTLREVLQH